MRDNLTPESASLARTIIVQAGMAVNTDRTERIDLEALTCRMTAKLAEQRVFNKIRAGAATRTRRPGDGLAVHSVRPEGLPAFETPTVNTERKDYSVEEFLAVHDAPFIDTAYTAILGRQPDPEGRHFYLDSLRELRLEKAEILARLRYSKEGRRRAVRIKGLLPKAGFALLFRVPILGYAVQLINLLLRGPIILRRMRQSDHFGLAKAFQIDRRLDRLVVSTDHPGSTADRDSEIKALRDQLASWQHLLKELSSEVSRLRGQHTELYDCTARFLTDLESTKLDVSKLLTDVGRSRSGFGLNDSTEVIDDLYARLDDRLRGTEAEIMDRAQFYIPYLDACASSGGKVVDLGSGRGEWLRLAQDRNCRAEGVELNTALVKACVKKGLDVKNVDIFEYLAECDNDSIGLVSAFHVIEHLPPTLNLSFLRRILQVLRPGGIVILETPNPENLQVGACRFYMDPTHKNPIPPQLLNELLAVAGFVSVQIHRLHPMPEKRRLRGNLEAEQLLNSQLFGPQDYAAIAYKEYRK